MEQQTHKQADPQGGPTAGRGSGRGPYRAMLGIIAAMLVVLVVSVAWHLGAGDGGNGAPDAGETSETSQLQQSEPTQIGQAPRTVRSVKKAKSRKQLVKLAGAGAKGRRLSVIGSSYSLESPDGNTLRSRIDDIEKHHELAFVMLDVKTGQGLSYNPAARFYCASAIKGPYVIALSKWKHNSLSEYERDLMTDAIEISDNKSYETLHGAFGSSVTQKMMRYSGASSFKPEYSYGYGSARDFARFWITGYWYFFEDTNGSSKWCRGLFDNVNQSFVRQALKSESRTYTKAGWFPGDEFDNVHNDAGIVMAKVGGESRPYVIAVMSTAYGDEKQLRRLVRSIDAVHADMMYE